jgi:hypothetical protein
MKTRLDGYDMHLIQKIWTLKMKTNLYGVGFDMDVLDSEYENEAKMMS